MNGVVSVSSVHIVDVPIVARVDDIISITSPDLNVVIAFSRSVVNLIGISPEVFVEGVSAVLVVAEDVNVTVVRRNRIVVLLVPVCTYDVLAAASNEEAITAVTKAEVQRVIA